MKSMGRTRGTPRERSWEEMLSDAKKPRSACTMPDTEYAELPNGADKKLEGEPVTA